MSKKHNRPTSAGAKKAPAPIVVSKEILEEPVEIAQNIAVIISCNNEADVIEKAFRSVIEQDYKRKEIVIVDDASEDNSWETICKLIGRPQDVDDFISNAMIDGVSVSALRHEFKTGLAGVMLAGANIVWKSIDLIGLLHASDEYLPGKLSRSIEYIGDAGDRVGLVYSDYETFINGMPITIYQDSFIRDRLAIYIPFGDSVLVTKKAIEAVGMVNPNKGEDALRDLWLRITERFVAIHVPEVLTKELRLNAETRT